MKFNIKNTIGIIGLLISQGVAAQFYVGAQLRGAGGIDSDIKGISANNEFGGAIKAGYIYAFSDHIGVGTGVEFSQYKQDVFLSEPSHSLSNPEVDASTSAFIYSVTTSGYEEKQTLQAIQIPLFVQYKMNIHKGIDLSFRAGAKYFLPVNYKINTVANSVSGTAYYPDVNLTLNDLPNHGFGSQNDYSASGEYETKGIAMTMFELGFTFDIGERHAIYLAMYFENGYGTILDQDRDESYIDYNPTSVSDRAVNGLYSTDKNAKIRPVTFGTVLAWQFK